MASHYKYKNGTTNTINNPFKLFVATKIIWKMSLCNQCRESLSKAYLNRLSNDWIQEYFFQELRIKRHLMPVLLLVI